MEAEVVLLSTRFDRITLPHIQQRHFSFSTMIINFLIVIIKKTIQLLCVLLCIVLEQYKKLIFQSVPRLNYKQFYNNVIKYNFVIGYFMKLKGS